MKINATNSISAGEMLFEEGNNSGCMYMVLKGKVAVFNRGFATVGGAGSIFGIEQMNGKASCYSCKALEEASVYALSADGDKGLQALLAANKDYNGITIYNHVRLVTELAKQYKVLTDYVSCIYKDLKGYYEEYFKLCGDNGCATVMIPEISQFEAFQPDYDVNIIKDSALFLEYSKIPYDAVKAFFAPSILLTVSRISEMAELEEKLVLACGSLSDYLSCAYMLMAGNEDMSLYRNLICLAMDLKRKNLDTGKVDKLIASCCEYTKNVKAMICSGTSRAWTINDAKLAEMKDIYEAGGDFRDENDVSGAAVDSMIASMVNSLQGSFEQLVGFAEYPEEGAKEFGELLEKYIALPDKDASDDEIRKIKKSLTEHFYSLYRMVFLNSIDRIRIPKAVDLMLDYGFVSERLLTNEQLVDLVSIRKKESASPCVVYTMREWLTAVYNGDKEPSRNDMGQDYVESLRELRKTGSITEADEKSLLNDNTKKVEFEIKNVMVHANRVVNGQLTSFIPILHSEMFIAEIDKAIVNASRINETVSALTAIDFSVFCREALFVDEAHGIDRELQMKNVYPVFVIFPTVGENVIMWQEITGRKRDSEGRFFAPAFTYSSLSDMLIKAMGNFRWALCKTIQGTNWNNIQIKSLTAEYSDYIQFYRKNHDLSDERKEKIKLQIQRGRNNLREVFAQDYETWMKSEANGAIKLNKIVREMLATYCPFGADIRTNLMKQPIFDEAFARSVRERGKKVHELELRYKSYEAKGITIPEELKYTLSFYKNL